MFCTIHSLMPCHTPYLLPFLLALLFYYLTI